MAMAFTFSVLENSARNYVLHVVGVDTGTTTAYTSDGSSTGIIAANSYTPTTSLKVRKVVYNTTNCVVRAQWHQNSNAEAFNVSGYGELCYTDNQGLINPKGTGSSGDIDLTTYAIGAVTSGSNVVSAMFSMTIECIKGA